METSTENTRPSPTSNKSGAVAPAAVPRRRGGCHCGAVRFEAAVDLTRPGSRCNCTICTKTSVTSAMVKPEAFTLLSGEDRLASYAWGAAISRRFFCRHCGIHCFGRGYLEEVGGDYVAINLNCVDDLDPTAIDVIYWDGRHNNWEAGPRVNPWPVAAPAAPAASSRV
jgi:hypothetical protein